MLQPRSDIYSNKGGLVPLTDDELRRMAPSIFATGRHASRSERYVYVNTADVLKAMRKADFVPFAAQESRARKEHKKGFVKHLIRFRAKDWQDQKMEIGTAIPEAVLINSHDGSSAYQLLAGMFRLVCTNGLIIADRTIGAVRIPHTADAIARIIAGTDTVLGETNRLLKVQKEWLKLPMNEVQQKKFAKAAHKIRWKFDDELNPTIDPDLLLNVRRPEDAKSDLWTVFNRVQENAVRGGLTGQVPERVVDGERLPARRVTSKEVRNINDNVKLNQGLWELAEATAVKLKEAA